MQRRAYVYIATESHEVRIARGEALIPNWRKYSSVSSHSEGRLIRLIRERGDWLGAPTDEGITWMTLTPSRQSPA